MKRAAIALALGLCAAPAYAQCADEKLQAVADKFFALSTPGQTLAQTTAALKAAITACPNDAYALKIGVMGFDRVAQVTQLSPADRLAFASDSYGYLREMHLRMPTSTSDFRSVRDAAGNPVRLTLNDSSEVMKSAITTLLTVEALAGRTAPSNAPPKASDPAIDCNVYQTSVAQQAMFWINGKQDSPGAMNILDRLIAKCTGNDYNLAQTRAQRARARIAMIKRTPERADRKELLLAAMQDFDTYKASGKTSTLTWGALDDFDLSKLTSQALATWPGFAVAEDKWFDAANLNKTVTNMSIAAKLDEAYALDQAEAAYSAKRYIALTTPNFNKAKALPEKQAREARLSLYTAAKMHADGVWRADANKNLRKPPDFLYNWINPDYVAPVVATPAAPAKPAGN